MDSLLLYSGGTVLDDTWGYLITDDLNISESDSLFILETVSLGISPSKSISVFGYIETDGQPGPLISSISFTDLNGGLRIESGAEAHFRNTEFSYGGGIKCISGNVTFENCNISYQQNIATSGSAIDLFQGSPMIIGCTIRYNQGSAISSPGNIACAPSIIGCTIEGNNTENSNRPQINLGASGLGLAIIQENLITGNPELDQVGGIAVASLFGVESNVLIQGNTIRDNRYGLALFGNGISASISDNIMIDNNTQGNPLLGGSGINLNGNNSSSALVAGNSISGNLWGITVQGEFQLDMGDPEDLITSPGNNSFYENGNSGLIYALYNNTPSPIKAANNCWIFDQESTLSEIEDVIFHELDDTSLGLVDFSMPQCVLTALDEHAMKVLHLFPNPTSLDLQVKLPLKMNLKSIRVIDGLGSEYNCAIQRAENILKIETRNLSKGLYILQIVSDNSVLDQVFIKE